MTVDFASEQVFARESSVPSAGDGGSEGLTYILHSTTTAIETQYAEVLAWLDSNAPATLGGQQPSNTTVSEIGEGYWRATLTYSTQEAQANSQRDEDVKTEGDTSWSFQVSAGTQNIKIGKKLVSVYPSNATVSGAFGNKRYAMGVDADGHIDGIDVIYPEASWEETYYTAASNVTQAYRLTCLGLVGKVNNATFRGADQHTVLLAGVNGQLTSTRVGGLWQLSFSFLYQPPNSTTFTLVNDKNADPITFSDQAVTKTGWQAYDLRYSRVKFDGLEVSLPYQVLVHQVYDEGDFSLLNLP